MKTIKIKNSKYKICSFRGLFILLLSTLACSASFAESRVCENYFIRTDVLNVFSADEKVALQTAAVKFARLLTLEDKSALDAKRDLDDQIGMLLKTKKFSVRQHKIFKKIMVSWVAEQNAEQQLSKKRDERDAVKKQRSKEDFEKQNGEKFERARSIMRKYKVNDISSAFLKSCIDTRQNLERELDKEGFEELGFLLDMGADINFVNSDNPSAFSDNPSALITAVMFTRMDIIDFLIQKGINLELKDNSGETALTYAIRSRRTEIVRKLIEAGADLNAENIKNKTQLMFAVEVGSLEIFRMLLKAGADTDYRTSDGNTVLGFAEALHSEVTGGPGSHGISNGYIKSVNKILNELKQHIQKKQLQQNQPHLRTRWWQRLWPS